MCIRTLIDLYFSLGSVYVSVWWWWRWRWGSSLHRTLLSPRTGQHGQSAVSAAPERCAVFFLFHPREKNFLLFFFFSFLFRFLFFHFLGRKVEEEGTLFLFLTTESSGTIVLCFTHITRLYLTHTHTIRCAFAAAAALRLFNNRFAVVNHVCCASSTPKLSREAFTAILKSSEKKTFCFFKMIFKKLLNPIPDHP